VKRIPEIHNLLKNSEYSKKILVYMGTLVPGENFDPFEKVYDESLLNPHTIKGLVRQISPEALVWKQYGLSEIGSVEILTDQKHINLFKTCKKVVIDDNQYTVFKDATGSNAIIQERPNKIIRVILKRR